MTVGGGGAGASVGGCVVAELLLELFWLVK